MTTDIEMGDSVTTEILTLDGTDSRSFVKTTVLDTDLVLISWYRKSAPANLESLVYQVPTGQSKFGDGPKIEPDLIMHAVTKGLETLYTFPLDYNLASYHIAPISKYVYAITVQAAIARTRSLVPDTNGLLVVNKNGTVYIEQQYYDDEWVSDNITL